MTDFSLQLGPVSFTMTDGGDFGRVVQSLDFGKTARADVPRLAVVRGDVPRTFSFPALIDADTKDEAIQAVRAANRALSVTNTLIVQSANATSPVTFRTYPSGSVEQLPANEWEIANWQFVQVTITVEPYAYGDLITDAHSITAPGTISLDAMGGDYAAPLAAEIEIVDVGETLHAVYLALNEQPGWDGWITAASGLTWTNMSAAVGDASAYGGYHKYTTGTDRAVTQFDVTDVPDGDYLVLVRAKMGGASAGTIDIDSAARWTVTVPATGTTWRYYEVGDLSLPYTIVRGAATSLMPIGLTSSSGSNHLYVDQIVLLPYRAGYQSWHAATDSTDTDHDAVYFAEDGAVYLDDVCDLADATGAPIHSRAGELIVLCDEQGGDTDHTHLTATLTQTPRYSLWR